MFARTLRLGVQIVVISITFSADLVHPGNRYVSANHFAVRLVGRQTKRQVFVVLCHGSNEISIIYSLKTQND